jgi:hypothetical protein
MQYSLAFTCIFRDKAWIEKLLLAGIFGVLGLIRGLAVHLGRWAQSQPPVKHDLDMGQRLHV